MSIDPSAIPNFGGVPRKPEQPQSPQGQAQPAQDNGTPQNQIRVQAKKQVPAIIPDQNLVKQLLDRMKLKYTTDKHGDLVAPWRKFRTYFMFRGEENQRVISVRTFYDRPHTLDDKPRLLETIDEWNRRTLWPKVYTHTNDEGVVRMIGEVQMLIGMGVAPDHFVNSFASWVRASMEFDKWIAQQLGLDQDQAEPGDKPGDGTGDKPGDGTASA
ncbi:YbjN domain-containing protein [Streptomyces sp. 7-21]|uniref:YbjN domain-containing protein n=1 Tax=Streptomyces sp. 7-21 TaxID=2802283 RepID=UPI00191FAEDA|nr:YbjN domain-containing protein [Streptomyces sp. 7-21]MBL1066022.1 YbjN domain-containing protein [Streptomyces sp. 7-21]